jgi:hypothetical protein
MRAPTTAAALAIAATAGWVLFSGCGGQQTTTPTSAGSVAEGSPTQVASQPSGGSVHGSVADCPRAVKALALAELRVIRFFGPTCPSAVHVRDMVSQLPSGRVSLEDLDNRLDLKLALGSDGVPLGRAFHSAEKSGNVLVPASSRLPASGGCGATHSVGGRIASAGIYPDTPEPACLVVAPRQHLRIVNKTDAFGSRGRTITINFVGLFHARLAPEEAATFSKPFGSYLAPGDHLVSTSEYAGPEVLLRGH